MFIGFKVDVYDSDVLRQPRDLFPQALTSTYVRSEQLSLTTSTISHFRSGYASIVCIFLQRNTCTAASMESVLEMRKTAYACILVYSANKEKQCEIDSCLDYRIF